MRRFAWGRAAALAALAMGCQTDGGFVGFDPCCKKPWEDAYPGNEITIESCPDGHSCDTAAERLTKQGWILVAYGRAKAEVGSRFAYVWRRPVPPPRSTPTPVPPETPGPSPSPSPLASPSPSSSPGSEPATPTPEPSATVI